MEFAENLRDVKEIIILTEKREEFFNKLRQEKNHKMEHFKISKLLNDSTVLKFVTRKWIEVHDLSIGNILSTKR